MFLLVTASMSLAELRARKHTTLDSNTASLRVEEMEQKCTAGTIRTDSLAIQENKSIDAELLCLYVSGHDHKTINGCKRLRDAFDVSFFTHL